MKDEPENAAKLTSNHEIKTKPIPTGPDKQNDLPYNCDYGK